MTALHGAVHRDDVESVRALLKAGASVDATNRYGVTPLYIACLRGNTKLVAMLLTSGADPNKTIHGGETPLMTASRTGKTGPVQGLLKAGAKVDAKERRGQTALMWASADGHAEVVELLLKHGADLNALLPDSGFSALLFAVREGRVAAARALLKAGADVNRATDPRKPHGKGPRKGTSPLILAVENGHFDLAAVLLESGADPNDQRSGYTALHALTWVRKANRGDGDDGDPEPIGSGEMTSLQFVRRLVRHGARVNERLDSGKSGRGILTRKGTTPFMLAAVTADLPYMRLLVELGADPLLPNTEGSTPLMAASGLGSLAPEEEAGTEDESVDAVAYCLERCGSLQTIDANGESAMHGAAYKSFPKVVRYLADHGIQSEVWNRTNKWGWSPLDIASGHRVGNFNPSAETIRALNEVMQARGIKPAPSQAKGASIY